MDDTDWRRSLYLGAGLSVLAIAIMIIFGISQGKSGTSSGGGWVFTGIQLLIAAILFGIGFKNRREGCLTRILLVFAGGIAILIGLTGLLAVSMDYEPTLLWKGIIACAIDEIIIGIIAFRACI